MGNEAIAPPVVQNGTYTCAHPSYGHFTVKLHTVTEGNFKGKRILSILYGPDNSRDFAGVAFWDDEKKVAFVWRKHRSEAVIAQGWGGRVDPYGQLPRKANAVERKLQIWACLATRGKFDKLGEWLKGSSFWGAEGYTLQRSGVCAYCNRKLTDPVSIATGVGPDCAEKHGVVR